MTQPSPQTKRRRQRLTAGALLLGLLALAVALYPRDQRPSMDGPHDAAAPQVLSFVVTDPAGQPVTGARIVVEAGNRCRHEATTGPAGRAKTPGCGPGPALVRAEAPGLARRKLAIPANQGPAVIALRMAAGIQLAGRVQDERGTPVTAAKISARVPGLEGSEETWLAITDDTGRFSFDTLTGESLSIEVSAARHDRTVLPAVVPSPATLEIVLLRTAAIAGKVVDAQGTAAADIEVSLAGSGVWPPQITKTDAAGAFRFEPLPEGIYELRAARGDLVSEPFEGLSVDAGQEVPARLELAPGARLQGRVFDARSGKGLGAAQIQLGEDALSATPKAQASAADGGFELRGLRAVPHRLAVRIAGYVAFDGWVTPGGKPLEVGLLRASVLAGSVVDEDGQPVALAELEVRGHSEVGIEVRIGATFGAPLMAAAALGGSAMAAAVPSTGSAPDLPSAGDNLGVTQGRVPAIPLAGPLPGAAALGVGAASLTQAFRSDEQGAFRLEGLPPGVLRVVARKPGYAPGGSEPLTLAAGAVKEGVSVVLSRGGVIVGRLVDTAGAAVEHVRVEARIEGDPDARSALSDEDGSFRFEAMRGQCSITAFPYGLPPVRAPVVQVGAGEERTLALVIDAVTHTLEGRVLDSRQRPLENASINLRALDARSPFTITVLSGPDGRFEIPGLPAPPYRVSADQAEYAPSKPLKVTSVDEPVTITLAAGSDLRGMVIDASSNEPLAGAHVSLVARIGKATLATRSHADGSFEFLHVNDGNYSVLVDAEGMIPSAREIALAGAAAAAESTREETFVLTPAGSASGDVVDRLGAPLWNAEVAAGRPAQWARATRTDHAGHFVLEGLQPGDTQLSARERSAGEVALGGSVRVYARQETPGVVLRLPGIAGAEPEPDEPAPARKKRASEPR